MGFNLKAVFKWLVKKEKWSDNSKKPRFYATDECDSCRLCYDSCPTGHIKWIDNKPEWEKPCLMCAACSTVCPLDAIQYGVPDKRRNEDPANGSLQNGKEG